MTLTEKTIECAHLCARLEIAGQDTKTMARECGGFRVKRCKTGPKSPSFWPRKPVAKRFSGLICPIFRSRTAGIASRSAPGLRNVAASSDRCRAPRIAPRGVRYRCCQQLISIPNK